MNISPEKLIKTLREQYGAGIGVCEHTDDVGTSDIFIAFDKNGEHIVEALRKGAIAVVCDQAEAMSVTAPHVDNVYAVENIEKYAFELVQLVYADTLAGLSLVGITGTNGKTTTAYFACQLFKGLGAKTGYLGTIGYGVVGEELRPARNTTPDFVTLYRNLASLAYSGCRRVVMEVSSHGIALNRIRGLDFETLVFTNLSQDHLDFHGDMEAYEAAKLSLFYNYDSVNWVVNADDTAGAKLIESDMRSKSINISAYSRQQAGRVGCVGYQVTGSGVLVVDMVDAESKHIAVEVNVQIDGKYNMENLLCAMLICHVAGYTIEEIGELAAGITSVPGRMQCVKNKSGVKVCVDYAHTPAGMDVVMRDDVLINDQVSRTWCIFGCGGDRDNSKRAAMGAAASLADRIVVTDDNVRGDLAEAIICDILQGLRHKNGLIVCRDRRKAVNCVLSAAKNKDLVLLLGKGDEASIAYGEHRVMHRDIDVVLEHAGYS